jgi:hypothetical protein
MLPDDKWHDYIPKRPVKNCDSDKDDYEGEEENSEIIAIDDDEQELLAPVFTAVSQHGSEEESSENSGFDIDEYGDIIGATQEPVTDSQLSTYRVFDPDETQIPGSLS